MNSKHGPKITIVTATYNRVGFIGKCLESVENQTYKNIEHVFNDSYSTDGTVQIIKKYIKRNNHKYPIKFFQTQPGGIAKALNDSLPFATGDITHFLHSDDYYLKNSSLEEAARYFIRNPNYDWITGNHIVDYKGKIYTIKQSKILKLNPKRIINLFLCLSHENTFVKTDLIRKYGGFVEDNKITVEYRLWLRLIQDHLPLVVDHEFVVLIAHDDSASHKSIVSFLKGIIEVFKSLRGEGIIPTVGPYKNTSIYKQTNALLNRIKNI